MERIFLPMIPHVKRNGGLILNALGSKCLDTQKVSSSPSPSAKSSKSTVVSLTPMMMSVCVVSEAGIICETHKCKK
jgi:hypothetical protein